jgi:hypothetical protein
MLDLSSNVRTYRTYSMLLKILPFALHKILLSKSFPKEITPILRMLCYNGSLVNWAVVSLTTAKFKPHMFKLLTSDLQLDYLYSLETDHKKHIRCPAMNICEQHRNTSSSNVVFTAHCIATEVIRLLPAYPLSRECVHQVVAQQRVYMSHYKKS